MNGRTLALILLGSVVALLALAAGAASAVQALTVPDSVRIAQHARAAGVTGDEARTVKALAEAEKVQAEAREIAARSWFAMAEQALGLVACAAVIVGGGLVAAWGVGLVRTAQRLERETDY